jgi:ATP-dependent RNA helicase UAP56/SUB2
MSGHDNEELIDYEDEHDVVPNGATASTTNGAGATATDGDGDKDKKNFSGIHSTGFRYVLVFCQRQNADVEILLGTSC